MTRELYPYFERELSFMREMAGEFARKFPAAASLLDIERHRCDDPHVERLIEAFCLISARVHHRLDADFPEITQSFLNLVFPEYLRPIPSMSIAQFKSAEGTEMSELKAIRVAAGESLMLAGQCQFRTCYNVEVWPMDVAEARVLGPTDLPGWATQTGANGAISLRLHCEPGFRNLSGFQRLRFYLSGANHSPFSLYELIFNHCRSIIARNCDEARSSAIEISLSGLSPGGFGVAEGVLPYQNRSFLGFRCLHEYFCFPEKFLFVDLAGVDGLSTEGFGSEVEILMLLDGFPRHERFERIKFTTSADNFQLGCTPVVNLFSKLGEPIRLDQRRAEYSVEPDSYSPMSYEVFSIDSVTARNFSNRSTRVYHPFFSLDHSQVLNTNEAFWHATRRWSDKENDGGTEVFLTLVDSQFRAAEPPDETLLLQLTCTNRDLPSELVVRLDHKEISFPDSRLAVRLLQRPTRSMRPPLERNLDWRVISHIGLNYLTLAGQENEAGSLKSAQALREMLELYNFSDDPAVREKIRSIRNVRSEPHRARVQMRRARDVVPVFCHGVAAWIDFDPEPFATSGLFLFASVLEHFLALFTSINSFTKLSATTDGGKRILKQWPPRSGERVLL